MLLSRGTEGTPDKDLLLLTVLAITEYEIVKTT